MDNPRVNILIVHMNGEKVLDSCLKSLSKTDYTNYDIHLLLNSTTDNSEEVSKKHNVKIHKSKINLGFAGGFNFLLEKTKNIDAKYIASIGNDTEVEPNWLTELVNFAEKNKADICQSKIRALRDKKLFENAGASGGFMDTYGYPFCRGRIFSVIEEDSGQYDNPTRIFWACGVSALFRKELFNEIGKLDKDFFMYAEETDFNWRANLAGKKIYIVPSSVIYHWGGYSINKEKVSPLKEYYLHRNTLIMFFKNYSDETIRKLKYKRIFLEIISALTFPRKKLIPITKALYWISRNKKLIKQKHNEVQRLRKLRDDEFGDLILDGSIAFQHFYKGKNKFSELGIL